MIRRTGRRPGRVPLAGHGNPADGCRLARRSARPVRVGVVQLCSTDDLEANLEAAAWPSRRPRASAARFVALPENFAYLRREGTPFPCAQGFDGAIVGAVRDWARSHRDLAARAELPRGRARRRAGLQHELPGGPGWRGRRRYRKIHLFDVDLRRAAASFTESASVAPGREVYATFNPPVWSM